MRLDFVDVKPTHLAFKPMVRELAFDVCEMAIVTFLMAKAHGKPLALLPAVMLGRVQHHCMLYNAERGTLTPDARRPPGRRARLQPDDRRLAARHPRQRLRGRSRRRALVTFEDAHVAEYRDPPQIERATAGKDLTAMLLAGEIDAAIYGAELPTDPRLKSVIPEPATAAQAWYRKHGVTPVNHLVAIKTDLVRSQPDAVREVYRLLSAAKRAAPAPAGIDPAPFGITANRPALELIIDYCLQQRMIPRRFGVEELFADVEELIGTG